MTQPNFTVVTSGGCNAKCTFCTDDMNRPASKDYIQNLAKAISELPSEFTQVSITGGEPTISPDFLTILYMIKASNRFQKVVLTTNGTKLAEFIPQLRGLVHHVNISRHGVGTAVNQRIFGNKRIPDDAELTKMCTALNKQGIDVTLNHVYHNPSSNDDLPALGSSIQVKRFAEYARNVGASAVAFRFNQNENTLAPTFIETQMERDGYAKINEGGCPVCRSHTHLVNGMPCMFKASIAEPADTLGDDIYELIYHVDGRLCSDWAGTREYDPVTGTVSHPKRMSTAKGILNILNSDRAPEVAKNAERLITDITSRPTLVKRPAKINKLSTDITSLQQLPVADCDQRGCGQVSQPQSACGGQPRSAC